MKIDVGHDIFVPMIPELLTVCVVAVVLFLLRFYLNPFLETGVLFVTAHDKKYRELFDRLLANTDHLRTLPHSAETNRLIDFLEAESSSFKACKQICVFYYAGIC